MKVVLGKFRKKGKRVEKVQIDGYDCWNADHTIALVAYPLLKKFKQRQCGHPPDISLEEWHKILDKMIWAMRIMADEEDYCTSGNIKEVRRFYKRLNEGFCLFGKHFRDLWY